MNIATLIAKFLKSGLAVLSTEEKALLKDNVSLMSPDQRSKFEKAVTDEEADNEGSDEDADESDDEKKDKKDEADEDGVDEKALRDMISKSVQDEITSKVDGIASQIVAKFVAGAKAQRKKAIDTGKPANDPHKSETREFMKALLSRDVTKLKELQTKTTTYNYDDDGARGGYLIPEELKAEVLRIAETQYGVARREMLYLPFTGPGNTRKIPTLASSVTVGWVNEGAKKGGTNPTFGLVTQTLKKLAAIIPFTEELLEDSAVNLTQLVAQLFAEAVAKEEDIQFFRGTGSPWTGLLNNGSVNVVNMGAGEDMSDITADDLLDMIDATPAGALSGAKFYLHRHALSYIRKLKDVTSGQYIYQNPGNGLPGTIWNYPYELVEACPDKTAGEAQATGIIAFGNLKLGAVFGDKQQIRAKVLDQATITDGDGSTVINLAEQDMVALRLEERVGYVMALPTAVTVLKTGAVS
jgi:HK97 family phage major capsid protein